MNNLEPQKKADCCFSDRFPSKKDGEDKEDIKNPAIQLYGRRFYKDQTPIEYLSEFLLVFASKKGLNKKDAFSFNIDCDHAIYWPEDRIALKLFSFFPHSKLDTRHPAHHSAYNQCIENLVKKIETKSNSNEEKEESIQLLQSLFMGFVGVSQNRTWVTNSFLPASSSLLAREVTWLHSEALKDKNLKEWPESKKFFATDRHIFMARGGELLFLQLANLFLCHEKNENLDFLSHSPYRHIKNKKIIDIKLDIEKGISNIINKSSENLIKISEFVSCALNSNNYFDIDSSSKKAPLGWIPSATISESVVFAVEINNICQSNLSPLEKIDLLQLGCCMHVLRTLCCQAQRKDSSKKHTTEFFGQYSWIVSNPLSLPGFSLRKISQISFGNIENLLYRVLRKCGKVDSYKEADKNGFEIFKRIGKKIGLIVPNTGPNPRFVLPPTLLRFLVAALLAPGERVRLSVFYERVFAHYGIALGSQQLATALRWNSGQENTPSEEGTDSVAHIADYSVSADTAWIEEALKQGGFLVELSDAISIVYNPGAV